MTDEQDIDVIIEDGELDRSDELDHTSSSGADESGEEDSHGSDESLADSSDSSDGENLDEDPERQAIRERRRQERQEKKQRQRDQVETLRRELQSRDQKLADMQKRLDLIDRRNSSGDLAKIQEAKQKLGGAYNHFKEQVRLGTEAQNGAVVAEATEKMGLIRERMNHLNNVEKAFQRQAQTPPPLDPLLVQNAQSWTQRNSWYDPSGRDQDSRVVLTIDNSLAEEGFDPRTTAYWDELDSRVKKYLPHRASRGNIISKPKSVVPGSGREASPGAKTFRLSADRVQAIKDMGIWDDVEARNRMIKQYRDYDKANGGV